jgi:hypothetical protein
VQQVVAEQTQQEVPAVVAPPLVSLAEPAVQVNNG